MNNKLIIRGYHFISAYKHSFIRIFYQNIKNNEKNVFVNNEEANFSLKKNKYSILKYIDNQFRICENGAFEFILLYEEINKTYHWLQNSTIHSKHSLSTGYTPLHIEADDKGFEGLGLSNTAHAYIDGMSSNDYWWYSIGQKDIYTGYDQIGIPGPVCTNKIVVNEVSLWLRMDEISLIKKLPLLNIFCTNNCARRNRSNIIFLLMIALIC